MNIMLTSEITTLQEKLYEPVDALQKTTRFIAETEIQV
jgi:hypothetical protein